MVEEDVMMRGGGGSGGWRVEKGEKRLWMTWEEEAVVERGKTWLG